MKSPDPNHDIVARALATARVRAVRLGLLGLHKAALDAERLRYERVNGRIESAQAALRLALDDPWFQWLHPLAAIIVQMDERLAEPEAVEVAEAEAFSDRVRGLLQHSDGQDRFRVEYHRLLQEAPDVVMAHAHVVSLLAADVSQ